MTTLTASRWIVVQDQSAGAAWSGTFGLAYARVPKHAIGDLNRNPAFRVLIQDADARALKGGQPHFDVPFHDPRLAQAAVQPDHTKRDRHGNILSKVSLAGSVNDVVLPLDDHFDHPGGDSRSDALNEGVPFAQVHLTPALAPSTHPDDSRADWPPKTSAELELPPTMLASRGIPVGVWKNHSKIIARRLNLTWPTGASQLASLFGGLIRIETRKTPKGGIVYVPVRLVPEGIEFDALMSEDRALPIGASSNNDLHLRLRLECDGAGVKPCGYRLRLIGGADWPRLRDRFDTAMAEFAPPDSLLGAEVEPGIPPLFWRLQALKDQVLSADAQEAVEIDAERVRARLRSESTSGADLPAVANLRLSRVTIAQTRGPDATATTLQLACDQDSPKESVALALSWRVGAAAFGTPAIEARIGGIVDSGSELPSIPDLSHFQATAETTDLDQRLRERYAARHVLPPDPDAPIYAFIPLERGRLQVRTPSAVEVKAIQKAARAEVQAPSVFTGLIRTSMALDAKAEGPRALVEVVSARKFIARVTITRGTRSPALTGSMVLTGAQGRLVGNLWVCEASPTAEEILPTLDAGPASVRALPISFGLQHRVGWAVDVEPIGPTSPDTLTLLVPGAHASAATGQSYPGAIVWRCRSKMPLVSAIAMTRTAANARRPSTSRDLVPDLLSGTDAAPRIVLRRAGGPFPIAEPSAVGDALGWPWPAVASDREEEPVGGVSLVPVTLPGVEFTLAENQSLQYSLRYDLPILGELFAGAVLKQEREAASPESAPEARETPTALDPVALTEAWARASNRLASTRTLLDCVIPWGGNRTGVEVKTLIEPFTWTTDFAVHDDTDEGLPLGRYQLGRTQYAAATALMGLNQGFLLRDKRLEEVTVPAVATVDVVGFAVALRQEDRQTPEGSTTTHHIDTRGLALESIPGGSHDGSLSWRAAGLVDGTAHRYVTTRTPIPLSFGWDAAPVHLQVRDLAMRWEADAWHFDGQGTSELHAGSSADSYKRDHLVHALHEWRLIAGVARKEGEGIEPRYSFSIGPLRFRPLRLHTFSLRQIQGRLVPQALVIVGTVSGPDFLDVGSDPDAPGLPRDERAYRSGNLVALEFKGHDGGLRLTGLSAAAVRQDRVEIDHDVAPRVTLMAAAVVEYQPGAVCAVGAALPIELDFDLTLKDLAPALSGVMLKAQLFGRPVRVAGRDGSLVSDRLVVEFEGPPDAGLKSRLRTDHIRLSWLAGQSMPTLVLSSRAILVPDEGPNDFVTVHLGGALDWLASHHRLTIDEGPWRIDHTTGVIDLALNSTLCEAGVNELVRGLPLPAGNIAGMAALAVDGSQVPTAWPDFAVVAGLVEFTFAEPPKRGPAEPPKRGPLVIRQRLMGRADERGLTRWCSTLMITAGQRVFRSRIRWPIGALDDSILEMDAYAPRPGTESDWIVNALPIAAGAATLTHCATVWIREVELPASRIEKTVANEFALVRPWRFKAITQHTLRGAATISWTSINEVALVDIGELRNQVGDPTYAFAARYVDDNGKEVKSAGVVERAFARAGFPTREVLQALAASDKTIRGLLVTGAGVTDIVTTPPCTVAGKESAALGVTVTLPWLDAWDSDSADLGLLCDIPQAPSLRPNVTIAVSRFDLANAIPQRLDGPPTVSLGVGDGSVPRLKRQLALLFGADSAAFDRETLRPSMVVDQAFTGTTSRPMGAEVLERPLFLRTLCGLKRIAASGSSTPSARTILATSANPGRALALTLDLVADCEVPPELAPREAPPEPAAAPSAWEMVVLGRQTVSSAALPSRDYSQRSGSEGRHLGRMAFSCAAEPLSIWIARIDDARERVPNENLALHLDWFSIALPAQLERARQTRVLRGRNRTLFASPALGWPAEFRSSEAARLALQLGDERPIQDSTHAWSGRARSLSGPAHGWAAAQQAKDDANRAAFLAFGRRVLFRRPSQDGFRAPPDRALTPIPPRARAPLPEPIRVALPENLLRRSADRTPLIAPLLPGQFEIIDTGVRAGVMALEHDGYILTSGTQGFDSDNDRFGRPADRGPTVHRQVRAPRSTALPADEVVTRPASRAVDIERRRRTFVAQDELSGTDRLKLFKMMRGPATVLRYLDGDGNRANPSDRLVSSTLRVIGPDLGRLSARWNGKIILEARCADSEGLAIELARIGLLPPAAGADLRAELLIGEAHFPFATFELQDPGASKTRVELTFSMADDSEQHRAARLALDAASPDLPVALLIRMAAPDLLRVPLPSGHLVALPQAASTSLREGPPRNLRLALPRVPIGHPWLPVETATVVFGDPAYDRRLTTPGKSEARVAGAARYLFATDRAEYDRGETIYFAVGQVTPGDEKTPSTFDSVAAVSSIALALLPKPSATGESRNLIPLSVGGIQATPVGERWRHAIAAGKPYAIAISSLRRADRTVADAGPVHIEPGDRLQLMAQCNGVDLMLDLGLVPDPVIAPAEAVYSLITLQGKKADPAAQTTYDTATPALHASAPLPQMIEFPDLIGDLALGHVRRRALFVWSYVPRGPQTDERAYLVKYDRSGAAQLPSTLEDFAGAEDSA